jgi:geranylgeranyl pyrophosphate synthase
MNRTENARDRAMGTAPESHGAIERALEDCLLDGDGLELVRAARYAVLGGGHRWRGMSAIASCAIFHGNARALAMPVACGVELVHAASLVLDDLPSMDNADTRRSRPSVHKAFPRWVVDMLPAYLVNRCYRVILLNPLASTERVLQTAEAVARAGDLLASGQEMDLTCVTRDGEERTLLDCYGRKSGSLFAASLASGAILGGAGSGEVKLLYDAGMKLGIAYQLVDDVGDAGGCPFPGSAGGPDAGRCGAVELYGREGALDRARQLVAEVSAGLAGFGEAAGGLRAIIRRASAPSETVQPT